MTPNIFKSHKDTSKFLDNSNSHNINDPSASTGTTSSERQQKNDHLAAQGPSSFVTDMDADHSAKTLEQGANAAQTGGQDLTEGIHESVNQTPAAGDKATGHGTSMFSSRGAVGKQFTSGGAIGGTAQALGGPFDQQGAVGKHFTEHGSVGGTFENLAKKNEQH